MKRKSLLAMFLILMMVLSACGGNSAENTTVSEEDTNTAGNTTQQTETEKDSSDETSDSEYFTDRDFKTTYDESTSAMITLNGSGASCDSNAVDISGGAITIKDEGTYIVRGTLDDGMLLVNVNKEKKVQIVLDNASIHSETCAPIYVYQADKVFVTLAQGSENTLSNGGSFTAIDDNNIDSVIFSKEDLTLNGSGKLTLESPAGHGIVSKDELTITGGEYVINCASHGMTGKDNVCIADGSVTITSGKDGIHAENDEDETLGFVYIENGTFDISAEGDGISAGTDLTIENGTFAIVTGGGSENGEKQTSSDWGNFRGGGRGGMGGTRPGSMTSDNSSSSEDEASEDSTSIKGMKAAAEIVVNGGTFEIDSADDAVHSNGNITVNGGTFTIATGDDGFHADDTLKVTAGTIDISESYEGLEGLHVLVSGGQVSLIASDDGFNAAGGTDSSGTGGRGGDNFGGRGGMGGMGGSSDGSIVISGGNIQINASGDGIDANGYLEITGGTTIVSGPFSGDTATLDYDTTATISGGIFIGTGASGMAQTFSDSEQGVIAVNAGNQNEGARITLEDADGNLILEHEAELSFAVVILSSPEVKKGETYKITVGDASGEFAAS